MVKHCTTNVLDFMKSHWQSLKFKWTPVIFVNIYSNWNGCQYISSRTRIKMSKENLKFGLCYFIISNSIHSRLVFQSIVSNRSQFKYQNLTLFVIQLFVRIVRWKHPWKQFEITRTVYKKEEHCPNEIWWISVGKREESISRNNEK